MILYLCHDKSNKKKNLNSFSSLEIRMTLTKSLIPKAKNGVGAFVFSCRKIEFNYCERSGSSYGMM